MSRVMVVDDDKLVLTSVQMILIHAGHNVVAVDRAHDGIAALERRSFDLIITDLFMPEMDGYRAIREFRRLRPETPVIAMSGIPFGEIQSAHALDFLGMASELGAVRTLNKPFRSAELLEAVDACVRTTQQQFSRGAQRSTGRQQFGGMR